MASLLNNVRSIENFKFFWVAHRMNLKKSNIKDLYDEKSKVNTFTLSIDSNEVISGYDCFEITKKGVIFSLSKASKAGIIHNGDMFGVRWISKALPEISFLKRKILNTLNGIYKKKQSGIPRK